MIILKIENRDFPGRIVNRKGQPVIGSHVKAPAAIAQLVRFPERKTSEFIAMFHACEERQLNPDLANHSPIES